MSGSTPLCPGPRRGPAGPRRAACVLLALPLLLLAPGGSLAAPAAAQTELANLTVDSIDPSFYRSGEQFLCQVHIRNTGNVYSDSFTVRLEVDGAYWGYTKIEQCGPGGTVLASFNYVGPLTAPPVTWRSPLVIL